MSLRAAAGTGPEHAPASARDDALLHAVWASAMPATLHDAAFRFVDVNDAFVSLLALPRAALIGTDPVLLQPAEDRESSLLQRQ